MLEISRFSCMLFLSVRGFSDYAGPTVHSRLAWLPCCLPLTRNEVGILIYGLFAAQSPRPPMPLSTLQESPRDVPSKTRGQDGFATSFPVGLLHPLTCRFIPARSSLPVIRPEQADGSSFLAVIAQAIGGSWQKSWKALEHLLFLTGCFFLKSWIFAALVYRSSIIHVCA